MRICSHLKAKQTSTHSPIHSCRSLNALYPSWEETSYTNWVLLSTAEDKLESGVPIDKGHKIMTLMAEDEPPQTKRVHLPEVMLKVGTRDGWGELSGKSSNSPSKTQTHMAQEKTVPSPSGGLAGHRPCDTRPD